MSEDFFFLTMPQAYMNAQAQSRGKIFKLTHYPILRTVDPGMGLW
jgi:hypothetical protein